MDFSDALNEYVINHSSDEPSLLKEITRQTYLTQAYPQMLSGNLQGRLLSMISKMICPKRVVEIGTFTGYSCLCLAEGLAENGVIHTIEVNPELEERNIAFFNSSPYRGRIFQHIGNALEIIPDFFDDIDLVFIDADKEEYLLYYNLIIPKMRKGGIVLADNVLWGGKVIKESKSSDKETQGILEFNRFVVRDPRVEVLMLPLRDGLSVIRKK